MRELSSNDVFRGQFPMKQDCGGAGSDITGRCPAVATPHYACPRTVILNDATYNLCLKLLRTF